LARILQSLPELPVAIDSGGTFTDCVWRDPRSGEMRLLKVLSTPSDPSRAIRQGLRRMGWKGGLRLLHGTTVGTNTLLQRRGGRVAFVTTQGFEDTIQIGRQARPRLYDLFFEAVPPLVPPELRFGVHERTSADGRGLEAPSPSELAELRSRIRRAGVDAIAISLLFSFADPGHEEQVAAALEGAAKHLSVAHRMLPEFREYERASTVVMNAYLQPVMQAYLRRLQRGVRGRVFVMQSSGGLTAVERAAQEPVRTVLSGPAGGVMGAAAAARRSGAERLISIDMGGTSTDVCLVDGAPTTTNESEIAGLPIRVPMLDVHTVGAGGGSLARFDAGGALRVGPESAGADPGPICYGRGTRPTVTDANLLLGRLPADRFLGGEFRLDPARCRRLTRAWLKRQGIPMSLERFAEGVLRVVNANMEKAVRVVSIERGHDPRRFALVAFGGAGGLHACDLAAALEIPRVIVPPMPGALSALGVLGSDVVKDFSHSLLLAAQGTLPATRLQKEFRRLRLRARREFQAEGWKGKVLIRESLDLRYLGQGFELNIAAGPSALDAFHRLHRQRYGFSAPGEPVEIVTVRLRAWLPSPADPAATIRAGAEQAPAHAGLQSRPVYGNGRWQKARVVGRESLTRGRALPGPAVITEYSGTIYLPPAWWARPDGAGNLILERAKGPSK
jgi:N-methylhydantoinase A